MHLQLTGALSHVLPIMLSVMVSKWVGDAFGKEGIYASWIAMRKYPWLPPAEYRDNGETAANVMTLTEKLILVKATCTVEQLGWSSCLDVDFYGTLILPKAQITREHTFRGYPVVTEEMILLGYVTRDKIRSALGELKCLRYSYIWALDSSSFRNTSTSRLARTSERPRCIFH
jgi:chloride channel 3/4/5